MFNEGLHTHSAEIPNELIPTELTSVWGFFLENMHLISSVLEKIWKAHCNLKENAKYFCKEILDVGT